MNRAKRISPEQIPAYLYEGYYWYSDEKKPKLVHTELIDPAIFKKLPFIIEGNLFAEKEAISINIRNVDGIYHITQFDLSHLDSDLHRSVSYIGHDIGENNFEIIEAWEEQKDDELLAGLSTRVPVWSAFAGFTPKKN